MARKTEENPLPPRRRTRRAKPDPTPENPLVTVRNVRRGAVWTSKGKLLPGKTVELTREEYQTMAEMLKVVE